MRSLVSPGLVQVLLALREPAQALNRQVVRVVQVVQVVRVVPVVPVVLGCQGHMRTMALTIRFTMGIPNGPITLMRCMTEMMNIS